MLYMMASLFMHRFHQTLNRIIRSETKIVRHLCSQSGETNSNVSFSSRTHLCGELRSKDVGKKVLLCGWLQFHRLSGAFMILRDWKGSVQLMIPPEKIERYKKLPLESVVQVKGQVVSRPPGQEKKTLDTGDIEIIVEDIDVLNPCNPNLPIDVKNVDKVNEALRIKYRYLDLRLSKVQDNLRRRSKLVMAMREFLLNQNQFVEIETPTLFRRTPGGAREFVVPTHHPGKFYCLPQSPQQFKQLLMVGGLDRYFQVARCYRDEGSRPDRQPEFTQIDVEMSFVTKDNILSLIEQMILQAWPDDLQKIDRPFKRMTYEQAMTFYGSDKPDTRFDWPIKDISKTVEYEIPTVFKEILSTNQNASLQALRIPQGSTHLSRNRIEDIKKQLTPSSQSAVVLVSTKVQNKSEWLGIGRYFDEESKTLIENMLGPLESSDLILFSCGVDFSPHLMLGHARLAFVNAIEAKGVAVRNSGFSFLWVDDFPLFLPKEDGSEGLESAHHPFTAPHPDDEDILYSNPEKTRGLHYDLVLNGAEIGGGSVRIHDSDMQRYVLENVLKEDSSELNHLLEALDNGCPPHGGIALGLDRLLSILCNTGSIRDVIAFPKIQGGKDPLSNSPASIHPSEMTYYHLTTLNSDDKTQ